MNSKQQKTLASIFINPPLRTLAWMDIESLLLAVGCRLIEGSGSRVAFLRDGYKVDFHRPHPRKEAKPYQIRDAKQFLLAIGVTP